MSWIRRVMEEVGFNMNGPANMFSDNESAITWVTGKQCPSYFSETKHVNIRLHFIRDLVREDILKIRYVCSKNNDADIIIKPLLRIANSISNGEN